MLLVFLTCLLATVVTFKPKEENKECSPNETVCEYRFKIHEALTMLMYPFGRVHATKGVLHLLKEDPMNITTKIPEKRIIMADGFHRLVTVINNQLPGPPIIVYEGQEVVVHVNNDLTTESTSLHWHGLHLVESPWMDGATMVTQCPINPGQQFTYKFKAYPVGTHYYHAHVQGQRMDGLFGALIVKPRPKPNTDDVREAIMQVNDWWHESSTQVHLRLVNMDYASERGWRPSFLPNGVILHPVKYYSALLEGRGRYEDKDTDNTIEIPYKVYKIDKGQRLRFRLIASGSILSFRVSVDNHPLTVIATDGNDVEPRMFESVIVNSGERIDFLITANQNAGNFWIRADSLDTGHHQARGILRYNGAPEEDPTSTKATCSSSQPCLVLNCMFQFFPRSPNTQCVSLEQLESPQQEPSPLFENDSDEFFLNFAATSTPRDGYNMYVNGRRHVNSFSNIFLNKDSETFNEEKACNRTQCVNYNSQGRICRCFHNKIIPFNKTIQVVLTSVGIDQFPYNHPIHLHGYNFRLLKIGYPPQNRSTGRREGINEDIECADRFCHTTRWKRRGDRVRPYLASNPIKKDTVNVPAGGYVVIRFTGDNPGKWLIHCHVDFDQKDGMAVVFDVAPERQSPAPVGMPVCKNFMNDPQLDEESPQKGQPPESTSEKEWLCFLFYILLAVFICENIILYVYYHVQRQKTMKVPKNEKEELNSTIS